MLYRICFAVLVLLSSESIFFSADAETVLPVVTKYKEAADPKTWNQKTRLLRSKDVLPDSLVERVVIDDPSMAFRQPYPNVFLQNERVVVCNQECDKPQELRPNQNGRRFEVLSDNSTIQQATAYFWVNKLFDRMQQLGYVPSKRLLIYVDRKVRNLESGVIEDNNAFFNHRDWTLSFLPADNPLVSRLLGAGIKLPTAYDPSVAMHEAAHSVFQELVGPTLNREIFGLHEAFADYFAMATLDSPAIGMIMMKGKALRDASMTAKYESAMESHDLGHVVGSALWTIRGLFADKALADRVALETIREVSGNPFATAASVSSAYQSALGKFAALDEQLASKAAKVWRDVGLIPTKRAIDTDFLKGKIDSGEHVVTSFVTSVPGWAVLKQGVPKESKITIGLIDARQGPTKESAWLLVSTEDGARTTPYWLFYDINSRSILAAYDLALQPVKSGLVEIAGALSEAISWNLDFGKKIVVLFKAQLEPRRIGSVPVFPSLKRDRITQGFTSINGRVIAAKGHLIDVRGPALPSKILLKLLLGKHYADLESVKSIRLVTVASRELRDSQLIEAFPGEKLVGYEIILRTGVVKRVMLEGIAEQGGSVASSVRP